MGDNLFAVGARSESGTAFALVCQLRPSGTTTMYVDGQPEHWSTE